jgi:hypothetical protein
VPGGADPTAVRVIDEWAKALDRGDIDAAARYFAIPSSAENGAIVQIQSLEDARRFNSSLPCGARLVKALPHAGYTIATFRLTERPGPGRCGGGTGGKAATAFFIKDGHIADWQRVASPQERKGGGAPAPQSSA